MVWSVFADQTAVSGRLPQPSATRLGASSSSKGAMATSGAGAAGSWAALFRQLEASSPGERSRTAAVGTTVGTSACGSGAGAGAGASPLEVLARRIARRHHEAEVAAAATERESTLPAAPSARLHPRQLVPPRTPPTAVSASASACGRPILRGDSPFEWENSVDASTPLQFLLITRSVDHPSSRFGSADEFAQFGCDCEDGVCGPNCDCAQDAEAQYTPAGRIRVNAKVQRYRECWERCSCACKEAAGADDAHTPEEIVRPKRGRPPRQPVPSSAATLSPVAISSRSRCWNRVIQRGPIRSDLSLLVFRTSDGRGWGLKTRTPIESGSYVATYIGERIHEQLTEERGKRYARVKSANYIYTPETRVEDQIEPDQHPTKRRRTGASATDGMLNCNDDDEDGDLSDASVSSCSASSGRSLASSGRAALVQSNIHNEPYSIDAARMGHLSRFINHDHEPNLMIVEVLVERRDTRFVHGAFFATKAIPAGAELTFDYGKQHEDTMGDFVCACATCTRKANRRQERAASPSMPPAHKPPSPHKPKPTSLANTPEIAHAIETAE